jgi:hypothetical protein
MRGELALRDAVLFECTSADGEMTRSVVQFGDPAVRRAWQGGLNAVEQRQQVWEDNPTCDACGAAIHRASDAGLLPCGTAIVCKIPCFITTMSRINPTFSRSAALQRARGH